MDDWGSKKEADFLKEISLFSVRFAISEQILSF